MFVDPKLAVYGTTLAKEQPNPLSPPALAQGGMGAPGGLAQIPEGTVTTEHEPSTERKVMGAASKTAQSEMDAAQQEKLGAIDQKAQTDIAKEQDQAADAQKRAEIAAGIEQEREALRKANEQQRAQAAADRAKALEELEKTSKVTSLFDDMTPARKLLSAVAIGFGQYAASMNGGVNGAYQIFKDAEDAHRQKQEANIKRATEKVFNQTKSAEAAQNFFEKQMEDLDKKQVAKLKVMDLQLAAIEKTHPEAAARAAEARAQVQLDYQKNKRDYLSGYDTTVKNTGTTTQTSTGTKAGGQQAADSSTKQAVIQARETERSMNELGDFIKKNPRAWREYQKAALAEQELEAAKQGNEKLISSLQGFGVAKVAIDQRLKSPEARKINSMIAPMITAKAREMDPVGALNKDAYINAGKSLNLFTGPANEIAGKAYEYGERNKRIADEYERMTPALQRQEAQPTVPVAQGQPARAPASKISYTQDEKDALDWARANPGPKAESIKAEIRKKKGIR